MVKTLVEELIIPIEVASSNPVVFTQLLEILKIISLKEFLMKHIIQMLKDVSAGSVFHKNFT